MLILVNKNLNLANFLPLRIKKNLWCTGNNNLLNKYCFKNDYIKTDNTMYNRKSGIVRRETPIYVCY